MKGTKAMIAPQTGRLHLPMPAQFRAKEIYETLALAKWKDGYVTFNAGWSDVRVAGMLSSEFSQNFSPPQAARVRTEMFGKCYDRGKMSDSDRIARIELFLETTHKDAWEIFRIERT